MTHNEPAEIRAGDTTTWTKTVETYPPADGWTLKYYLTDQTHANTLTAVTSGTDYLITILSTDSEAWVPGVYTWAAFVEKGGPVERHTVDTGTVRILPNLATAVAYDTRTDARIIYDDLIAAYKASIASNGVMESFSVAGKTVSFKSSKDILDQVKFWAAQVQAEEAAEIVENGGTDPRRVGVRFNRL